jgi:H/ACA ribonucleoprotein complex subunit 2
MDVISHIPVLCEDHNIPYIYVTSRQQLGEASSTKRPTSVVMVAKERHYKAGTKPAEKSEEEQEHEKSYDELLKLVQKASRSVRI